MSVLFGKMVEVKNFEADKGKYKCFLLKVRSHQDYVCLEMDNCPSGLDFENNDPLSIDSSQVVMPVLDKIRFNIKSANCFKPHWFEKRLEVFAEGRRIFPVKKSCSKCNCPLNKNSLISQEGIGVNYSHNCTQTVPCNLENISVQVAIPENLKVESIQNVAVEDLSSRSKGEMLSVSEDGSLQDLVSLSLTEFFPAEENDEKSVQTRVSLGKNDLSVAKDLNRWQDFPQNFNSKYPNSLLDSNAKSIDTNRKARFWSLIKSARILVKMNREVVELNSILKNLSLKKRVGNKNPLDSLSPVNLILKLKKLNRSTNIYSVLVDRSNTDQYQDMPVQLDVNKLAYLNKLSETLSLDCGIRKEIQDEVKDRLKGDHSNKEDLNMDTLFIIQRSMLKMMETFLSTNASLSSTTT